MTEPLCRCGSIRHVLRRITIADLVQREGATLSDFKSSSHRARIVIEDFRKCRRRSKAMLGIRSELVAAGSQGKAVTNGRQYVLDRSACWRVVENLSGCDKRKSITLRTLTQSCFLNHFMFAPMARHHAIEPIGKRFMEIAGNTIGLDLAYC